MEEDSGLGKLVEEKCRFFEGRIKEMADGKEQIFAKMEEKQRSKGGRLGKLVEEKCRIFEERIKQMGDSKEQSFAKTEEEQGSKVGNIVGVGGMHKPSLEGQKGMVLEEYTSSHSSDDDLVGLGKGGVYEVGESSDAAAVTSETTWSDVVSLEVTVSAMALMLDRLVIMRPTHGWEHLQDLFHLPAGDTCGRCRLFDELYQEWEMHIEVGLQAMTLVFEEGFMRRCASVGDKLRFYQAVPPLHKKVFFTLERARKWKWKYPCSPWCLNVKVVGA